MFLSGWSSILSIVCFLLVSGVLSEEFKSLCVSKWHINQLRKSIMYFLLYATLNLLSRPSLRTGAKCLLHVTSYFYFFFSVYLTLENLCVTEREAFGLPAVPQNTFSHSHWSAPMLCWFGVPECFGLLELSCSIGTTVNQSPKRVQTHSWACAAADYTSWHNKCFLSFLY